jgi:hypothetical protein
VIFLADSVTVAQEINPMPAGATRVVNQDRLGTRLAICAQTGEEPILRGNRRVTATAVWVGEAGRELRRVAAGQAACDPAWAPDGRLLALTALDGLWVFSAESAAGSRRVDAKSADSSEFAYRAFSRPRWSPDGALIALLVTNGGTSWVQVFDAASGRPFYTSPPETYSFQWGGDARDLTVGTTKVRLPAR